MAIIDGNRTLGNLGGDDMSSSLSLKTEVIALEEPKTAESAAKENLKFNALVSFVKNKYNRSKTQRMADEQRWLLAFANYRGQYGSDVQFTDTEKSQAFVKITKTKVLAAYNQIIEILLAGSKFPVGIEPSPVPEGIAESVHFDPESPEAKAKQMGGGGGGAPAPAPKSSTIVRKSILEAVGNLKEKLTPIEGDLKEGPGLTPTAQTWEPAQIAAQAMDKKIQDQLEEAHADKSLRRTVFDMCLFGTGFFKGPFAVDKEYPKWDEGGKYAPIKETIADVTHVSIWDAYPDPDARNMDEAEYFIQRHKMSKTQLRDLKKRPHFRAHSIDAAVEAGTNYQEEYWESQLNDSDTTGAIDRFEVIEYWGIIDKKLAEDNDVQLPPDTFKDRDQLQMNVWICNDQVLRVVLNPFTPNRIPFHACPYELNPYSFFGVGVAENMEDTQLLMNGFMRLAVDNAVLSSNIIFEIDETLLTPGQDMQLHPGKIFRRNGGQPGQSIFATKFPNVTQECMLMFDKARQLADEATGMPSYSHGMSGVMGVGRTASGMSMLMGAAKENIKGVVRNIDDYLLVPLGKALFAFNMQFNFDKKFIGDVEVVARGTESLMRNEVRSQKLLQFLQIASNPMDAPFVKRDYILRELALSLDLEPEKVVNDPREAAIQAKLIQELHAAMGMPPQGDPTQSAGNPAGAPSINDPTGTGGGNIAPGMAPTPGAQGNTGSGGGMNSAPSEPSGGATPQ